jgi:hypothetical protein
VPAAPEPTVPSPIVPIIKETAASEAPAPNALTFRDITGGRPLPKAEETAVPAETKVNQAIEDVQLIKQPAVPLVASEPVPAASVLAAESPKRESDDFTTSNVVEKPVESPVYNVVSETTKKEEKIEPIEEPKINRKDRQDELKVESRRPDVEKVAEQPKEPKPDIKETEHIEQKSSAKSSDHDEQVAKRVRELTDQMARTSEIIKDVNEKVAESRSAKQALAPGGLILPQAKPEKPEKQEAEAAPLPHKLAPGEVYVDENGNVIIGE